MVVISSKYGRLGNRLLLFGHAIGFALAHGVRIANLAFDEYAIYFEPTSKDLFSRFPAKSFFVRSCAFRRFLYTVFFRLASFLSPRQKNPPSFISVLKDQDEKVIELSSEEFLQVARRTKIVFLHGWLFRDWKNFLKYSAEVRAYFTLALRHQERVQTLVAKLKTMGEVLIGIHIRRTDYAQWSSGKFFYGNEVYTGFMNKAVNLFPQKQVVFLICSDESLDMAAFTNFTFLQGTKQEVEDMYALSYCDYLIGPPSSFTLWASFYGNVPLYRINDPNADLHLTDFVQMKP